MFDQLLKLFGNEGFANLLKTGFAGYGAFKAGDMMNFQKDMMKKSEQRQDALFKQDQESRDYRKNLDFSFTWFYARGAIPLELLYTIAKCTYTQIKGF